MYCTVITIQSYTNNTYSILFIGKSQGRVSYEFIPLFPAASVITEEHTQVGCSTWGRLGLQARAVVHNDAALAVLEGSLFGCLTAALLALSVGCQNASQIILLYFSPCSSPSDLQYSNSHLLEYYACCPMVSVLYSYCCCHRGVIASTVQKLGVLPATTVIRFFRGVKLQMICRQEGEGRGEMRGEGWPQWRGRAPGGSATQDQQLKHNCKEPTDQVN